MDQEAISLGVTLGVMAVWLAVWVWLARRWRRYRLRRRIRSAFIKAGMAKNDPRLKAILEHY